jgi:hypothetical protein
MKTLRLMPIVAISGGYRVDLELHMPGISVQTAAVEFDVDFSDSQRDAFEWYFEDYLQYPFDPAPANAAVVRKQLVKFGVSLFSSIFQQTTTIPLWDAFQRDLGNSRIEIASAPNEAAILPWELLQPVSGSPLALSTGAFVRTTAALSPETLLEARPPGPIRILLVICRPDRALDVPFRSIAIRLLEVLRSSTAGSFELTALRPPTFEQLNDTLKAAAAAGRPYDVVHFDGHGDFGFAYPTSGLPSGKKHGVVFFETTEPKNPSLPVNGRNLGKVLAHNGVKVAILNACRSARAEPRPAPSTAFENSKGPTERAGAFVSLAHEINQAGVPGVVAMGYNVYVDTAAKFVSDLYNSLAQGRSLAESVLQGRQKLAADKLRNIGFEAREIDDWPVPVLYESYPLILFSGVTEAVEEMPRRSSIPPAVRLPEAGFWGRDETLLALDREFDRSSVALIHAFAGSGKTSTALEFARWYSETGALDNGVVLYTSFANFISASALLEQITDAVLRLKAVDENVWANSTFTERLERVFSTLSKVPVLWIWDDVEQIDGFPPGTPSRWTVSERNEISELLNAARAALVKVKILLLSRRDDNWLPNFVARLKLPPLRLIDSYNLAAAFAQTRRVNAHSADWLPLIEFAGGNPLTLTIVVRHALDQHLKSAEAIADFVAHLVEGRADILDASSESRSESLAASLNYGFATAFSEMERKQLAVLCLFRGFVDVDAFLFIHGWLDDLPSNPRETSMALLDRAAQIGHLAHIQDGYYTIHPALPWFFKRLLEQHYPDCKEDLELAFVNAMDEISQRLILHYHQNDVGVVDHLRLEEANLVGTYAAAFERQWWKLILNPAHSLIALYKHTGRYLAWNRLVDEVVPMFGDPNTGEAWPGIDEADWYNVVVDWLVIRARDSGHFSFAESIQKKMVEYRRRKLASFEADAVITDGSVPESRRSRISRLIFNNERLSFDKFRAWRERELLKTLAIDLNGLAQIIRLKGCADCIPLYLEAAEICERIGNVRLMAAVANNLNYAYSTVADPVDIDAADHWASVSYELSPKIDIQWEASSLGELARIDYKRAQHALAADDQEAATYLLAAREKYMRALAIMPLNASLKDRIMVHSFLGNICHMLWLTDEALENYQKAIQYNERASDYFAASNLRFNVAVILADHGSQTTALTFAETALKGFVACGGRAAEMAAKTQALITVLKKRISDGGT